MRRNIASFVAAIALIAVTVPCLLRLAQWRVDNYLCNIAAAELAMSAQGETPWRWTFHDSEDVVAGRVFDAGSFTFSDDTLTVQSDGRAFEIGLPLPTKPDLRRFPQMQIAASVDAPGRLSIVAAQDVGQPTTHSASVGLNPDRSVEPIALDPLPASAAMLRLRVELPNGARFRLQHVSLERVPDAVAVNLNAPPVGAATVDAKSTNAEIADLDAKSDVRRTPILLLAHGMNPNIERGLLERIRVQFPAAIAIPANAVKTTFAQARVRATAPAKTGLANRIGWIALTTWLLAVLAALRFSPRNLRRRAALEAALVCVALIAFIASGSFTGRLDAAQICFMAAICAYAIRLGVPHDWRFNGSARAWLLGAAVVAIALVIGLYAHRWDEPLRAIGTGHVMRYFGWALIQQYLICAVVTSRWRRASERRFVAIYLGALTFALMHTPNASLMLATFFGGLCWCALYLRERALLPIAVSHAASALILISMLPQDWLYSAEVSARFFQ
ncbi:MAG TPA: type II CAAX endopeptidase family protein [Rudaea sp.]|jgi:membrane protease YdiL (CAAX protease family)|nr:type II CAAX endopeptidase family protein [Rudaea sp.]